MEIYPSLGSLAAPLTQTMLGSPILNPSQLSQWKKNGFLALAQFFTQEEQATILQAVAEIEDWQPGGGAWLQHYEQIGEEVRISRTENFLPFHKNMRILLTKGKLVQVISEALGERAVLYKEKINYKYPHGGGYAAHQDATAYDELSQHISCLIAVDPATRENGCLEMVEGEHQRGFIGPDERGLIPVDEANKMKWEPIELACGDILLFHSYAPHRSGINKTKAPRRAIYATYNALSEGDLREQYYQQKIAKLKVFRAEGGEKAGRISLIGHFQGKSVDL